MGPPKATLWVRAMVERMEWVWVRPWEFAWALPMDSLMANGSETMWVRARVTLWAMWSVRQSVWPTARVWVPAMVPMLGCQ